MQRIQSSITHWLAVLAIAILSLVPVMRALRPHAQHPLSDVSHLTLSAACMLDACNPYDATALNREAATRREARPHVWREAPIYPPSSPLILLPFAVIRWRASPLVFDSFSLAAFACASMLLAWRLRPWSAGAFCILAVSFIGNPLSDTLAFGNPALLTVSLVSLASTLLLTARSRRPMLVWVCLGIALALKPPLAVAAAAVLLLRVSSRATAIRAIALSFTLLIAACLAYRLRLGSFAFLADLRTNLYLSQLPGASSDFSPLNDESFDFLNLQTILSRTPGINRHLANGLAWLVTLGLAVAGWLVARRAQLWRCMPWTTIAFATLVSVLPIYHRGYDRVLAILLAPAALELARQSIKLAWLYAALVCLWVANDTLMTYVARRWHFTPQNPAEELALCAILLAAMVRAAAACHPVEVDSIAV